MLILSVTGADLSAQNTRKPKKRFLAADSLVRIKLKDLADSIQRSKASAGDTVLPSATSEVQPGETSNKKAGSTDWLLPVAGIAVLAAAYFLLKRRKS